MTSFTNKARIYSNFTRTENNAVALNSTNSALLDLFATAGALDSKTESEVANMFMSAFAESPLFAVKTMFYTRNIRGGLGRRETFRRMLKALAISNPQIVIKNISLIPHFGRFDDLYTLINTSAEMEMWKFLKKTFENDLISMSLNKSTTLAAKWMKSINTSSPKSCELGRMTAKKLGLSPKLYRTYLSELRTYIDLTEKKMSANEWKNITYSEIPSRAMKNYRKAFQKHDPDRFASFISDVEKGESKINASTLYPYDILMAGHLKTPNAYTWNKPSSLGFTIDEDPILEAQWKALPNYIEGEHNVLVMADTSGSMEMAENGLPMATSVGLAVYFAERNKGAFKNLFMTFSNMPEFIELKGNSLKEKLSHVKSIVANTDLEAAFDLILNLAVNENIVQEEMPKSLIIITDMQFDEARSGNAYETFFEGMKKKFANAGYDMPTVVFWQVSSRSSAFQVSATEKNVLLVSGHSTSTFKSVLGNIGSTPYEFMVNVLSGEMYDCVVI